MIRWLLALLLVGSVSANPMVETRYCGPDIKRDADGSISRSSAVIRAFRDVHPCPSTGMTRGACKGWAANHTWPLACGGCDSVPNLSWVPNVLKSGPGYYPVDRWEMALHCKPRKLVPMPERGILRVE